MDTPLAALLERKGSLVHSVSPATSVLEAVRLMNRHKIGCLLVLERGQVAGVFTERDVLARVVCAGLAPAGTIVHDVMTTGVAVAPPEATITEAMGLFAIRGCRHLPVVRGDQLLGLISIGDISRWLIQAHEAEAASLRSYIAGELAN